MFAFRKEMMQMYTVGRTLVWMRRWKHSRGFGVQSPWAYRFIRYVLNEHYPYYAYAELNKQLAGTDRKTRKLGRLYFRLANYRQPSRIIDYEPPTDAYARYMTAGCKEAEVSRMQGAACPVEGAVELLRMSLAGSYRSFYADARRHADGRSIFVMEGIRRNKETKAFWKSVVADPTVPVTFDLYYCGILFFDKKRYKENYIVNF